MGQTEERKQVYFKSDFAEVFDFKDVLGREIPSLSGLDFKIEFWVNDGDCDFGIPYPGKKYIVGRNASGKKGVMVLDDGRVAVAFDRHLLPPGKLWGEITVRRVDSIYPDGYQDVAVKFNTGIELTSDAGCATDMAEMAVLLPFVKGKWEDLTPEEIAELQRPATEAAEDIRRDMTALEKTLDENEKVRIKNEEERQREENTRRESESIRTAHESERQTAERGRQTAETERGRQEDIRVSNENARVEAENKRAETFSGWKNELDSKAGREELSNIVGVPTEEEIGDLEPGIIATLLRTVPQVLSPEEQAQVKENIGGIRDVFIDLWNAACIAYDREMYKTALGKYDPDNAPDPEHPFNFMKLWLSYQEASAVLCAGRPLIGAESQYANNMDIRVNLPSRAMSQARDVRYPFYYCRNLEIGNADGMTFRGSIYGCPKLHTINNLNDIVVDNLKLVATDDTLVNLSITSLSKSINLSNQPRISKESFTQIISKAKNTAAITVTVHPDVYAKLTDAGNAEWHKVLTDAADKNITFATV